jgi:hypothetical protein
MIKTKFLLWSKFLLLQVALIQTVIEIYEKIDTKYFKTLSKKSYLSYFRSFCLLNLKFNMLKGMVLNL